MQTFHKMHKDFDNKEYTHCAIDFGKGILELIPGLKETLPEVISLGIEVAEETNKIIDTQGAILAAQGAGVAVIFIENTINATCHVIEENPFSTVSHNTTVHDDL